MKTNRISSTLLALALLMSAFVSGNAIAGTSRLDKVLYTPRMIFDNQTKIGLSKTARATIESEMNKAQSELTPLDSQLSAILEQAINRMQADPADESLVLEQIRAAAAIEGKMKAIQFKLYIRLKNILTPAQRAQLDGLR